MFIDSNYTNYQSQSCLIENSNNIIEKSKQQNIKSLFHVFEQIASKPTEEIVGRNCWVEADPSDNRKHFVVGLGEFMNTKCGLTYFALISAIFGKDFEKCNKIAHIKNIHNLEDFRDLIKMNAKHLLSDKTKIYAYGFSLDIVSLL